MRALLRQYGTTVARRSPVRMSMPLRENLFDARKGVLAQRGAGHHAAHSLQAQAPCQCQLRHRQADLGGDGGQLLNLRQGGVGHEAAVEHEDAGAVFSGATVGRRRLPRLVFPGEDALGQRGEGVSSWRGIARLRASRQRLDRPADELLSSTAVPQVSQLRSATSLTRIPHLPSFLYCTGARARRDSAYYTAALARSTGTGRACPPGSEGPSEADSVIEKSYPSAGAPGRSRGRKKLA